MDDDDIAYLTRPGTGKAQLSPLLGSMLQELTESCMAQDANAPDQLRTAMHYSMGLRGKRARGLLVLLVMDGWNQPWRAALDCARAVEMVHTASLIIDDLPCMDDARTRRGQPANHVKFGEPTAILAAIAMLSDALALLATSPNLDATQKALAVDCLAEAVGPNGMTGGQLRDLYPVGESAADIELTHARKTGTLFAAATELGCIAAGVNGQHKRKLRDCGMLLGQAFQEFDDLLDAFSAQETIGKDIGKDILKPTFAGCLGHEKAEARAIDNVGRAIDCMKDSNIQSPELWQFSIELTRTMRSKVAGPPAG